MHINTTTTNTVNILMPTTTRSTGKDLVACKPLESKKVDKVTSVSSLMTKNENLRPLEVLFEDDEHLYQPGDKIYLRASTYEAPHMRAVQYIDGVAFILVEKNSIIAADKTRQPQVSLPLPVQVPYIQSYPQTPYPYDYPWSQPVNPSYTFTLSTESPTPVPTLEPRCKCGKC